MVRSRGLQKSENFLMGLRAKFSRRFCNQCRSADWRLVESLHGSLHLLIDPITRGCGEKATVGVSQYYGNRGRGATEGDE